MDLLAEHLDVFSGATTNIAPINTELLVNCDTPEIAASRLPLALEQLRQHPSSELSQITAVRLLELTRQRENMLDTWAAFSARFPDNQLALRMHMRWLRRENRAPEGLAFLKQRFAQQSLQLGELFAELGCHAEADLLFDALLNENQKDAKVRFTWAKLLQVRGEVEAAGKLLEPVRDSKRLSATAQLMIARIDAAAQARKSVNPEFLQKMALPSAALHQAILSFQHRDIPRSVSPHLGGISFVTGTLGAGGAERQMSRLACALHQRQVNQTPIGTTRLQAAVEMVITNVSAAAGNDFFLPDVRKAGLKLTVLTDIEPEPLHEIGLPAGDVAKLAPALPKNALFGLQRLVAHYRRAKPEVAYIWQDGAVLIAALAALVAQVPRVVISVRGMPPNLRQNLSKDEFLGMYQALLQVPGVTITSNSKAASDAYVEWLGLEKDSIQVIHNASEPQSGLPGPKEFGLWDDFCKMTSGCNLTLGGVFRFDANKRPLLWLDFAKAAVERHPNLRFVLVGEGALFEAAEKYSAKLGLSKRVLFTGHSKNVDFWLSKMDALLLLSEFEGLPNVLIEAQMAGIPVISTPAGGALETFLPQKTGFSLTSAQTPTVTDFLQQLDKVFVDPLRPKIMGQLARAQAMEKFSLPAILDQTIRHFKGQRRDPVIRPLETPEILTA